MANTARSRSQGDWANKVVETVCVLVVLVAVLVFVVWLVTHAGGGVLNQS
jgi:bacteriorhodopsin